MSYLIASSSSTPPPPPPPPPWKHEVFLSFRGEDTRTGFTSHLYSALIKAGISTFRDDEKLRIGKTIRPELLKAIQESRFAIVVLSKSYASSAWCLDELATIVECMETKELIVVPVFYYVDPSDVRHQSNSFESDFAKHEEDKRADKVEAWRAAFRQVGAISGSHVKGNRNESEVIATIVRRISQELQDTVLRAVTKDLVGMESRLKDLTELLSLKSNDVRFIGICGMSGMGKTVLADAVYMDIRNQFEGDSFVGNIKDISRSNDSDLMKLQQKVLVDILKDETVRVTSISEGISMMRRRLHAIKILLVLDDVNDLDQLYCLAKERDWFGCGSRIIITTTNEELLTAHNVDGRYKCESLNFDEASRLFNLSAFGHEQPKPGYELLCNDIVELAGGLPLALNVFGSLLFDKEKAIWRDTLKKLRKCPEKRILERLEVCYDRLDRNEQEIFLYLACYLKGRDEGLVKEILKDIGLHPVRGIDILVNRSLIRISYDDSVWMHDLLQQMGWEIILKKSPNEPGKRRGLKSWQDIVDIATSKEEGTVALEVINQDPYESEVQNCIGSRQSFSKMTKLKFLRIRNLLLFPNGLEYLSCDLRTLEWNECSLRSLPLTFKPRQLFELDMRSSAIEHLWDKNLDLPNLRSIYLCYSKNLIKIPDLTSTPSLVKLNLEGCTDLVELHESVLVHKRLRYLNLKGCTRLQGLGRSNMDMPSLEALLLSGCSKLEEIPQLGENMKHLEHLYLDGTVINKLPENLRALQSLRKLDASGTAIREVPSSIYDLTRLRLLSFHGCPLLLPNRSILSMNLQRALFALKELDLSDCKLDAVPDVFGWLSSIIELDLSGNDFIRLPASISHLSFLRRFRINRCRRLQSLPELPTTKDELSGAAVRFVYYISGKEIDMPKTLALGDGINPMISCLNCPNLVEKEKSRNLAPTILMKYLELATSFAVIPDAAFEIVAAGNEIPKWFKNQGAGSLASMDLPLSWYDSTCIGIALCAVFVVHHAPMIHTDGSADIEYEIVASIHVEGRSFVTSLPVTLLKIEFENQSVWYWSLPDDIQRTIGPSQRNRLSISFSVKPEDGNLEVKKYGIRFMSSQELPKVRHFNDFGSSGTQISNTNITGSFMILLSQQLLEKIGSLFFHGIRQKWGYLTNLKRLDDTLSAIKSVLFDATQRKLGDIYVRYWLRQLLGVLYDLDNLFDAFLTEDMTMIVGVGQSEHKEISKFFSSLHAVALRRKMSRKMMKLRKRLEKIEASGKQFQFVEEPLLINQVAYGSTEKTNSFAYAQEIMGRNPEKEQIIKHLLSSKSQDDDLFVLGIYGEAGIGKTTLVKMVYNDPKIEQNFSKKIWVRLSYWDLDGILERIIKALDPYAYTATLGLYQLRTCLQDHLKFNKFLLVLDVLRWDTDTNHSLSRLKDLLNSGAKGSCILVATLFPLHFNAATRILPLCDKDFAVMGTFSVYHLRRLPANYCLSIFLNCAFKDSQFSPSKLLKSCKEIVSKCAGIPLAVRMIGNFLSMTREESAWSNILNILYGGWHSSKRTIIKLIYAQMPVRLQLCSAYCSYFPEGYEFNVLKLIYLWISEGLVQSSDENRPLEEIGYQYVNDLVSRSIFVDVERSFDDKVLTFTMNKEVHDFALFDAQSTFFQNDICVDTKGTKTYLINPCIQMRTLVLWGSVISRNSLGRTLGESNILLTAPLKNIRAIQFGQSSASEFEKFRDLIGTLKHLMYLCLKGDCAIRVLSNSICSLVNLLALDLSGCNQLQELPRDFHKLRSLRFLALTSQIISFPVGRGLSSLQFLYISDCCNLTSLTNGIQHLTALRELSIIRCPQLMSIPQSIRNLTSLEKLVVEGCERMDLSTAGGMEGIRSIQSLTFGGLQLLTQLPDGFQNSTLRYLDIKDCPFLETLPSLLNCTSLLKLRVLNCIRLASLSPEVHQLPRLRYLHLKNCPLLAEKCKREAGEYWRWIQKIPEVDITKIGQAMCSMSD